MQLFKNGEVDFKLQRKQKLGEFWSACVEGKPNVPINEQMAGPHLIIDQRVSGQAMNQVFYH